MTLVQKNAAQMILQAIRDDDAVKLFVLEQLASGEDFLLKDMAGDHVPATEVWMDEQGHVILF